MGGAETPGGHRGSTDEGTLLVEVEIDLFLERETREQKNIQKRTAMLKKTLLLVAAT